ncbi:methyl-accepting chemotaxis protein [Halothermothrix orenii]|uniref:Methyl-accepting chemotaxis sensory transducer n=1 Tax=Halothermothrix orenii (strain H 168 / OCM 544 / DSM 9562) TaxID=373903 RepID=B8CY32_HALOH|nr:methyl-accepting chemotaxis protein [Halothermothrix orenii]ACL70201.1 methyl-accepting chemotaxis sensory transducer [Halothermothrix orenii H 168]
MTNNRIFYLLKAIFGRLESFFIKILTRINIGKRLMVFSLILIISIVALSSWQSINTFSNYVSSKQKEKLIENYNVVHSMLEETKSKYTGYSKTIARLEEVKKLLRGSGNDDILSELKQELQVGGIELRDQDFKVVSATGVTGLRDKSKTANMLSMLVKQGIAIPFLTRNGSNIQLNAICGVKDGNKYLGAVIVSQYINIKLLNNLAKNTGTSVQLYSNKKLVLGNVSSESLKNINLITEDVRKQFNNKASLNYLIDKKTIGGESYLINYIPLKDYFSQPIGYFVLMASQGHVNVTKHNLLIKTLMSAALFTIISFIIISLISRSITVPLNKITKATKKVAAGDLTQTVTTGTGDQLAVLTDNFNKMITNLRKMVESLVESSRDILRMSTGLSKNSSKASEASQEVAAASGEIANGTEAQARQISKTTELLSDINKQAKNVSQGSTRIIDSIEGAYNKSHTSLEVMDRVSRNMQVVMEEVKKTNSRVASLEGKVKKINNIIEAINYLNEETTLLSLNASIEAARAGEAGRGFAVVAEEIKRLADESNKFLEEVNNIFGEINEAMKSVVESMDKSSQLINNSEEDVTGAKHVLDEIQQVITNAKHVSEEIHTYIEEQLEGTRNVASAIDEINGIAQNNASQTRKAVELNKEHSRFVKHISEAADDLSVMANQLEMLVSKFILK